MKRLTDKVAVITGGNSGIGEVTARLFAEEGAAAIAILDIKKPGENFSAIAEEIKKGRGTAIAIECDVTSAENCKRAFRQVIDKFGRVDVLVNSAGVLDHNSSVLKTSDELWNRTISINQNGIFYCCKEALGYMVKKKGGSIVNVSSVAGISANSGAAYSSSKHAVIGLSKNIAIQYAGTDIRCNVVCPGPTVTPMTTVESDIEGEIIPATDELFDDEFMEICSRHVDQSVGWMEPIDQAKAILFFASDDARCITGQWILVDKGFY